MLTILTVCTSAALAMYVREGLGYLLTGDDDDETKPRTTMKRNYLWGSLAISALLGAQTLIAQTDLKPAIRWNDGNAADWADGGNWTLAGSDPSVEGAPGAGGHRLDTKWWHGSS